VVKLSDYVIQFLAKLGIKHVFMMIGGSITHLVDSSIDRDDLKMITMHHEQGAAFAAEGYARCTGSIGVAMATSGPGATNLLTGIGSCYFDSIPCLFITGQVNTYEYKFDRPIRQVGFQETDIVQIVKPITKGARFVEKAEDIFRDLNWAVNLALSGRQGPVLLDIPMNIQRALINCDGMSFPSAKDVFFDDDKTSFDKVCPLLCQAKRPVILVGGGLRRSNACDELYNLVKKTGIPVVSSLMGLDAFPHNHPAYSGMIGSYGHRYANLAVANSDFLLILGSRLDTRQTGTKPKTFARAATIVRVDVDTEELNAFNGSHLNIRMDVKEFLKSLNKCLEHKDFKAPQGWMDVLDSYKIKFPAFDPEVKMINSPNKLISRLSDLVQDDAIIALDVGQNQIWAAQSFKMKKGQRILISGGMGSMGFALPAAIGASFANPNKQAVVIVGDGGLQVNIQELQTIVRNNLQIKIIVFNNRSLGMVRQFQEIYFNGRREGTLDGYDCPNFVDVAKAYKIKAFSVSDEDEVDSKLQQFFAISGPSLLEVHISQNSILSPKLLVNDPIENQDPKLSPEELKEIMIIPVLEDEKN